MNENKHLRGTARLSGDATAFCESDPSHEKLHGQPEPLNGSINKAGSPTRGAERGTAEGDGPRASGPVRTVPPSDLRHGLVSRQEDFGAQAVASPTFLVIALRWIALRGTPTGEKANYGLTPLVIELSPKSH